MVDVGLRRRGHIFKRRLPFSAVNFPADAGQGGEDGCAAEGAYRLGLLHLTGDALPAAFALGVAYLKRAAGMGHAGAHFELGQAYRFGRGVDQDMDTAWACYLFAATHGHAEAAMTLGVLYETGRGLGTAVSPQLSAISLESRKRAASFLHRFGHVVNKLLVAES